MAEYVVVVLVVLVVLVVVATAVLALSKVGIARFLAEAVETRAGVVQSLGTYPNGSTRAFGSEGGSTGADVAIVANTLASLYPPDPVAQPRAREAWNTMVLRYHAQKEQDRSRWFARSLSEKLWWQVHGHSSREAIIDKEACNMPSLICPG